MVFATEKQHINRLGEDEPGEDKPIFSDATRQIRIVALFFNKNRCTNGLVPTPSCPSICPRPLLLQCVLNCINFSAAVVVVHVVDQEVEILKLCKSIVEDGPDLFSLHKPSVDAPFR